jgi:hypothetical protein
LGRAAAFRSSPRGASHAGSVAYLLARPAAVCGDHAAADELFRDAARLDEHAGATALVVRDLRDHGEFLRTTGRNGDADGLLRRAADKAWQDQRDGLVDPAANLGDVPGSPPTGLRRWPRVLRACTTTASLPPPPTRDGLRPRCCPPTRAACCWRRCAANCHRCVMPSTSRCEGAVPEDASAPARGPQAVGSGVSRDQLGG